MAFEVKRPDLKRSPKTGMTRKHWAEAAAFLLGGVFQHVKDFDSPVVLPKRPGKSYPQPDDPEYKFRSAEFEGLSRTFLMASPVLEENPDLEVAGYNLRDYYANQILRATDPKAPQFVGTITEMARKYKFPLFQHTAEGAALAIGLMNARSAIWDRYTQKEKDQIAAILHDYAHNRTNSHNWRSFNVIMAAFLKLNGYEADSGVMKDHLQNLMAFYAGDGWYRDMGMFDYYSCWAFQFYMPIWCGWYGYEHEPEIAAIIERRHNDLMKTYPLMFGRNGHSLMWGRSIIYRCAAAAPFPAAFLLKNPGVDPGWARRIASGNLLQFIRRDDLFVDGVPSLGFYGTFEPLVQSYSCALSPFWLAKVYLAMHLPADSPFWTATENDGDWDAIGQGQKTVVLDAPGLAITADGKTGAAELRPGKVGSKSSNPNYTRLAYNTQFPWEADAPQGATAMAYAVRELGESDELFAHLNLHFAGESGGVYYRQAHLRGWLSRVDLADIILPGGVLRVDRVRIPYKHELRLGHFALPHTDGKQAAVERLEVDGHPAITATIPRRRLALVAYGGWDAVDAQPHRGLNPETEESTVLYAHKTRKKDYSGMYLTVTLMLHRTDDDAWTPEELAPIREMAYLDWTPSGQPCGLKVTLKNGAEYTVDFECIEGRART